MEKISKKRSFKQFAKDKNIEISVQRYLIDALSYMALGLFASLLFQVPISAEEADQSAAVEASGTISTNSISGWPQASDISSEAAVVMENTTNTILYSKNADEVLFPGSTVKIMTCLLALENTQLTDEVTMTATGVSGVTDGGASISSQVDEVFTVEQCLYAIMVASANDIALQIAEHVGGSVDGFVQQMNTRAQELDRVVGIKAKIR